MAFKQKSYRKFVATAATATLVASAVAPFASAASADQFTDVASKYKDAVNFLLEKGATKGMTETQFGVNENIKRVDAAVQLVKVLGLDTENAPASGFTDVPSRAVKEVNALKAAGITSGKTETTFNSDALITRGELAVWIQRAFELKGTADVAFTDVNKNYTDAVSALVTFGITNGINETQFGTDNNAKRGDFAIFLMKAAAAKVVDTEAPVLKYDGEKSFTVENGAAFTAPTVTATDNVDKEVKVTSVITDAAGKEVSAIDTKVAGVYTITYSAVDAAGNKAESVVVKVTVEEADPAVVSVSAINAKELKVTFNKAVSKASLATNDFAVTATGANTSINVTDVQLSEDGKTATLLLTSVVPTAGVDVEIVEGAILTSDFDKFPKFSTTAVKAAVDTVAPKLLSAVATDSTTVELTFDEPVDWTTNTGGISVNAGSQVNGVNSTEAGNYTYTFTVPTLKTGVNTVQLLNYADFAGNKEVLSTTTVNYTADVSLPEVAAIKAEDSTSFILTLNKAVDTVADTNITVKKGNYTFTSTDLTVQYVDANGNLTANNVPSKYVKVTVPTQVSSANPLYGNNENSVSLSVAVSGYKNGTVIGKDYTGSVTLSKDLTAPAVVSSKLVSYDKTAKTITVPFDKTLASVDTTKLTVVKGSVKIAATATVSGKNLVITISDAAGLTDGKYSLVLDKGVVKDGSNNVNEAITLTTDVTTAVTTTVKDGTIFGTTAAYDSGKNVITVNYGTKVSDSAAAVASYSLNGSALPSGTVVYFTSTAKDEVKIELPASYAVELNSVNAKISLNANAVKEDATGNVISSSATEVKAIEQVITLNDNVAPAVSKVEYVKNDNGLAVGLKLTFSEAVDTSSSVNFNDDFVIKTGSTVIPYTIGAVSSTDTATDNVVILNFTDVSTAASGVTVATNVDATQIDLKDLSGNNKVAIFSVTAQ